MERLCCNPKTVATGKPCTKDARYKVKDKWYCYLHDPTQASARREIAKKAQPKRLATLGLRKAAKSATVPKRHYTTRKPDPGTDFAQALGTVVKEMVRKELLTLLTKP